MHGRQMYLDFGGFKMDVTSYTMIVTCKLWGLSWAYADGAKTEKDLTAEQNEKKVVKMPTLLEYFSFVYFGLGCMCAPFHEYSDFKNWIELTSHYKTLPRGPTGFFQTIIPVLKKISLGLIHLVLHLYVVVYSGMSCSLNGKPEFADAGGFGYKVFYYWVSMTG